MAFVVSRIMTERPQGKGVLVNVLSVGDQRRDEIAGAHVVQQVAEEGAAERIVAKILDDASAVGVAAGVEQLLRACPGETSQHHGRDRPVPQGIDVRFVGQDGVGGHRPRHEQCDDQGDNGSLTDDLSHADILVGLGRTPVQHRLTLHVSLCRPARLTQRADDVPLPTPCVARDLSYDRDRAARISSGAAGNTSP